MGLTRTAKPTACSPRNISSRGDESDAEGYYALLTLLLGSLATLFPIAYRVGHDAGSARVSFRANLSAVAPVCGQELEEPMAGTHVSGGGEN